VLAQVDQPAPRAANTVLLAAIDTLLGESGIDPWSLCAIACGRGPGSFTGVRIGVATAKGLARGRRLPLVGFSTLDAIAWKARSSARIAEGGLIGVVGDAMRGEVYPALFRVTQDGVTRLGRYQVTSPTECAAEWSSLGEKVVLVGAGLVKHRAVFEQAMGGHASVAESGSWTPDGAGLVASAWAATGESTLSAIASVSPAEAYERADPGRLLPIYTRLSDAEEAERRRGGPDTPASGVAGPQGGASR
jgi:N6-L-threonylcarbamoyladenine synthase